MQFFDKAALHLIVNDALLSYLLEMHCLTIGQLLIVIHSSKMHPLLNRFR